MIGIHADATANARDANRKAAMTDRSTTFRIGPRAALVLLSAGVGASHALAQGGLSMPAGNGRTGITVAPAPMDPESAEGKAYAAKQKRRVELERELNLIRVKHFGPIRKTEIRQAGIWKLRSYNEAWMLPSLYTIVEREGDDVRGALLDQFALMKSDEGDTTIAWAGVFGRDASYREIARSRLMQRLKENDAARASARIQSVIAMGLGSAENESITSAAQMANQLNLIQAIPMLINAQIGGGNSTPAGGNNGDPGTALADIVVGTQTAFVSDLTPIVGDSAVAFDPKISVVTEGVVLRVINASVITYRVDVHNALVALSSRAIGKPTDALGWDSAKWHAWYNDELKPELARRAEANGTGRTSNDAANPPTSDPPR
jgi:hypothetical protein